ncbi:hypothetical protein M23134_07984 [Microscilla marina ATCC 23134]|uniref:Uncharacterized protein n=1 Tax=Microscilla marina ATCC 23134 TaxID=313606 RepID=A1ZWK7_MICM2|nr:hypothetical protein M23134_07984 [Microscilla marina ATCC 23134]
MLSKACRIVANSQSYGSSLQDNFLQSMSGKMGVKNAYSPNLSG